MSSQPLITLLVNFFCNYYLSRLGKNYHPHQVLKNVKQNILDGKWHEFTSDNCDDKIGYSVSGLMSFDVDMCIDAKLVVKCCLRDISAS